MTLPVLTSSAVNSSGTAVTTATFTRPTATGGTATDDLLIAVLQTDSATASSGNVSAFTALFPSPVILSLSSSVMYVGYRRATAGDPSSWSMTLAIATAHQASMFAYRNVTWQQDRTSKVNASSTTVSGVTDLDAHGPDFDVLPVHILCMDQTAARTLTPGAGHTNVFDSTEATTFLRTVVLHGVEVDADAIPLTAINSSLNTAEAQGVVAFTLAGVAYPSGVAVADGSDLPHTIAAPFPISDNIDIVADTPLGGGGATVPTTGQIWPRAA